MPIAARDTTPPDGRWIEARLRLSEDGVIAGTVSAAEGDPTPFHGWLELMDALEGVRSGAPRRHRSPA